MKMKSTKTVEKKARPISPNPAAIPMPAVTQSPPAVVRPLKREPAKIIEPAPKNPIPTIT